MSLVNELAVIDQLESQVKALSIMLLQQELKLVTVESCTGGLLAGIFTSLSGSSHWFDRGFITYSNKAKSEQVGVNSDTLNRYGAVSAQAAIEMADGGLRNSEAHFAISITGVAGPSGGSVEKPVGTVCIAWARQGAATVVQQYLFDGDRASIRRQSIQQAITQAIGLLR